MTNQTDNRVEAGKRILEKISDAIDGELLDNVFPAVCWFLGELGADSNVDKDKFMAITVNAIASAYDANLTKAKDDETTH